MGKFKRFLQTSGIYFLGNVLSKLVIFALLPLYTSKLTPEEFGEYDLIVTILGFAVPILFFQIWDGMLRFSFDKETLESKYKVITNSIVVFIGGSLIYTVIFFTVANTINLDYKYLVHMYGIMFALQSFYTFSCRVFLNNLLFVLTGLINTVVSASLTVFLILNYNFGVEAIFLSSIIGVFLQIVVIEKRLGVLKFFEIEAINRNLQLDMIKFSIPLCFSSIAYWFLSGYAKLYITIDLGAYSNGLYAIVSRFTTIVVILVSVVQYAWNELLYSMVHVKEKYDSYRTAITYLISISFIMSSILMLFIELISPILISESYIDGMKLLPIAMLGVLFNSLAGFVGTIFMAEKQTQIILTSSVIAAIINFIGVFLLAKYLGLLGIVTALTISFFVILLIRLFESHRKFNIGISWGVLFRGNFYFLLTSLLYMSEISELWNFLFIFILIFLLLFELRFILKDLIYKLKLNTNKDK